jgi:hypothetical protein
MRWQGKPAGPESADEGEEIEFNWWKMTTSPREEIAAVASPFEEKSFSDWFAKRHVVYTALCSPFSHCQFLK